MNYLRFLVVVCAIAFNLFNLTVGAQSWVVIPTSQEDDVLAQASTNQTVFATAYGMFKWLNGDLRDGVSFKGWTKSGDIMIPCNTKYPAPHYRVPGIWSPYINSGDWRIIDGFFRFTTSVPPVEAGNPEVYPFNFQDELNHWITEKVGFLGSAGVANAVILIRPETSNSFVTLKKKNSFGVWEWAAQVIPGETLVILYPKATGLKEMRGVFSLGNVSSTLQNALTIRTGVKKADWNPPLSPY